MITPLQRLAYKLGPCLGLAALLLPWHTFAATTFELMPGSTIALNGGNAEMLTGTFTWADGVPFFDEGTQFVGFDATALHFQSLSVVLSLNTTPLNNVRSFARNDPDAGWEIYFQEAVDAVGLPFPTVLLAAQQSGVYGGDLGHLTGVAFGDVAIYDRSGAERLGSMSFSAVAVPEPSFIALLLTGLTILILLKAVIKSLKALEP